MQNPSQGVAMQLQPHLHLTSNHRFPVVQQLGTEQIFRYLVDASSIVKQIAAMKWEYVAAPPDGTVWLEWIPLEKTDHIYPSDGYVWGEMEQSYRQEFGGYTIELRVQGPGYRPGHDQMATHSRTRYHFVSKNPSVNAPPPDPSLWIVHYHQANPHQIMPAAQVPVSPQMQQIISQRRWLESQGQLDRKEFMLHDREHWPIINIPGPAQMQQRGQYGANPAAVHMSQNRYPAYSQQAGAPPAKRPRTQGPGAAPGSSEGLPDNSIENEEDTALGDFFDHLTQRDISLTRYTQHHRWMEEVFSSPYASSKIVPPDLGLGLMGELKGLTEGILEPPNPDVKEVDKPARPKEPAPFTNLKKEQIDEFSKRVAKHLEEGQAQIERMKAEHAAKMQDWKKVKALTQAEKRLRFAHWEVHEDDPVIAYRLESDPSVNGQLEEGLGKENVEDVVKEVENMLKVKINAHQDATRISKGGLQDRKQPVYSLDQQNDQVEDNAQPQQSTAESTLGATGSAGVEAATYHEDPMGGTNEPAKLPQQVPQSTLQSTSNQPTPNQNDNTPQNGGQDNTASEALGDLPDMDMNDMVMDDMGMDVDHSDINFGDTPRQDLVGDNEAAGTSEQASGQSAGANNVVTSTTAPPTDSSVAAPSAIQQQQTQPAQTDGGTVFGDLGGDGGDTTMFNDTFDDLTNMDGNGDNDLIDFDGGAIGIDDSAFGDALHGMDAPGGSGDDNTPAGT